MSISRNDVRSKTGVESETVHLRSKSSIDSGTVQSKSNMSRGDAGTAQSKSMSSTDSETVFSKSMSSVESETVLSKSMSSIESETVPSKSVSSVESGTVQSRNMGSADSRAAQLKNISGFNWETARSSSVSSVDSVDSGTAYSSSVDSVDSGSVRSSSVDSVDSGNAHTKNIGSVEPKIVGPSELRGVTGNTDSDSREVGSKRGSLMSRIKTLPDDVVARLKDSGAWGDMEIWDQENEVYLAQLQEHLRQTTQTCEELRLEADNDVLIMKSLAAENDKLQVEFARIANSKPNVKQAELQRSYDALVDKHTSALDTNAALQDAFQRLEDKYAKLLRQQEIDRSSAGLAQGTSVRGSFSPNAPPASGGATNLQSTEQELSPQASGDVEHVQPTKQELSPPASGGAANLQPTEQELSPPASGGVANLGLTEQELAVEMWRERASVFEKERAMLLTTLRDIHQMCNSENPSHRISEQIGTLKTELANLRTEILKKRGQQRADCVSDASVPRLSDRSTDPQQIQARLTAILQQYDRVEGHVADMTHERARYQKEIDGLQSDYQSLLQKYTTLEGEQSESRRHQHALELHAKHLERQCAERTRELHALEAQSAELHVQMRAIAAQAEREHAEALTELQAAKHARASVEEHLTKMQLLHKTEHDGVADAESAQPSDDYGDTRGMHVLPDELRHDGGRLDRETRKTGHDYGWIRRTHVGFLDTVTEVQEEEEEEEVEDDARAAGSVCDAENDKTALLLDEQRSANLALRAECNDAKRVHDEHLLECNAFRAETEENLLTAKHEYDILRAKCDELREKVIEYENKFAVAMEENSSLLHELAQATSAQHTLERLMDDLKKTGQEHGSRENEGQGDATPRNVMELESAQAPIAQNVVHCEQSLRMSEAKWLTWMLE